VRAVGQVTWMDRETKSRRWTHCTRADVVRQIAGEHGFGADAHVEDTRVIYPQITQARCTDAELVAWGPRQADGVAREVVFSSDLADTIAVLFDPTLTPTGYAYLFCLGGHATFGVAQVRGVRGLAAAQRAAWSVFRGALGDFAVRDQRQAGQFMNFSLPAHLRAADGRWYVGEAAGVQDFLFGLGNRLAVRSAVLAADGVLGRWDAARFRREIVAPMRSSTRSPSMWPWVSLNSLKSSMSISNSDRGRP